MEVASTGLSSADNLSLVQCLFDEATAPMAILDLETLALRDVNRAAEQMTGRTRTQLLHHPLTSLWEEEKARDEMLQTCLVEPGTRSSELHVRRRGLPPLRVRLAIRPIESEQGSWGLVVFHACEQHADGTRENHPPAESESRYRSLVQNAPVCIHEIERSGQLISINPAGLKMIQATEEEVLGVRYLDFVEPPDRARVADLWQEALRGRPVNFQFAACVNGQRRVFASNFIPIRESNGQVSKVMGVSQDITGRLETERRLRESEQRFRTIFEQAAVGVALIETGTGRFVRVNHKFEELVGYEAAELFERTTIDLGMDGLETDLANLQRLRMGKISEFTTERPLLRKDGSRLWVTVTVSPSWNSGEAPQNHIAIVQDITARKQAEQALRHSETSLRKAQEIAHLGSWQLDFNTGRLTCSEEIYRMLGIEQADQAANWLASGVAKFVHPDDQDLVLNAVRQAIATGETPPLEFRHLAPTGGIRHLRAVAELIQDPQDGYQGIFGTLQDITERKETELALRESETRFRVIAEHCPAMVAIFREGKIRFVNDRVTQLLGYSREALLGEDFSILVHPEHRELVCERNRRRLRGEEVPSRYEFKLQTKQGDVCWIDFTAGLFEFEGEPAVLGIAVDVTERRSTEERLRQREMELAHVARLTTMGEMVAGIAHEINQPLSAISNFADACTAEISKLEAPQVPQLKRWTELIGQQAVRCGDIIRRLRGYVKQKKLDESDIQINDVVRESIALLRNEIQQSVITVQYDLVEPSPIVAGNSVELQQVMVNLLANAHEAMKRSGCPQGELFVRTSCSSNALQIDVEDNGPGIREQDLDRLCEAFFTTKSDGMGMGLAISRSIVERHGGRLWAHNREPHGAAFHIELPLKRGAPCVVR